MFYVIYPDPSSRISKKYGYILYDASKDILKILENFRKFWIFFIFFVGKLRIIISKVRGRL